MELGIKVDLETHNEHTNMIKLKVNKRKSFSCKLILFENLDP